MSNIIPIAEIANNILDKVIPDAEARQAAKIKMAELEQKGEFHDMDLAMANIMAEAQSKHKLVALARPMFMYVFYLILIQMVLILPIISVWYPSEIANVYKAMAAGFAAIPSEMWTTFTVGFLGYVAARSHDKKKVLEGKQTFLQKIFNK